MVLLKASYLATALAAGLMVQAATAVVWTEIGDAGDTIATAQTTAGNGPLTAITGYVIDDGIDTNVDMYCIYIPVPANFSATLTPTPGGGPPQNPLFLFRANPSGVGATGAEGTFIAAATTLTGQYVPAPGTYYLAITDHELYPLDTNWVDLWDVSDMASGIEHPPVNLNPFVHWQPNYTSFYGGPYTITLTGAGVCEPTEGCNLNCPGQHNPVTEASDRSTKSPDLNSDGIVDLADFALFAASYGSGNFCSDFDCSGTVDLPDFAIFASHWLHGPGPNGICL